MRTIILFICLLISGLAVYPATGNLKAYLYYCTFNNPEKGPFIETYITIIGNSAVFVKNGNGKLQASVEITIIFSKEDKVVDFRKYVLKSPEIEDNAVEFPNFIDQQRISLACGDYKIDLKATDQNGDKKVFEYHNTVDINYSKENIEFSGIELVESCKPSVEQNILSKCGYDLVPYVSDFFPENIEVITFYCELYNTGKVLKNDEMFLLRYLIESSETEKPMSEFMKFQRQKAENVNVLIGKMSIKELPSGNYNLVIEARNRDNQLLTVKKMFFQRSNPGYSVKMEDISALKVEGSFISLTTNRDSLKEYIKCLYPISDIKEIEFGDNLLKLGDTKLMQQFIINFWSNKNPADPAGAWMAYKIKVNAVNKNYSVQIKKGYETDRGRVYLQYGPPNSITTSDHEPNNYPYEVWQYYHIGDQSNCKFIFYNPELVGNEYWLLHSDVKGEISDKNWQLTLAKRTRSPSDILIEGADPNSSQLNNFGNHSFDNFKNPK
ncbi:MAG: GWxTD domain-containing protein [Bacteroidia bacterium]|nr:GWxTD domain-containing protein [Bacteroidia bacterium]